MNCICSNWDDTGPCPIHKGVKLPQPEEVLHHSYVIHVYRRRSNLKWYYTTAKDAIQIHVSPDFDRKPDLTTILPGQVSPTGQ